MSLQYINLHFFVYLGFLEEVSSECLLRLSNLQDMCGIASKLDASLYIENITFLKVGTEVLT